MADAERQAMLDKIRADMEQSRQRLAAMRDRRPSRGTILLQQNEAQALMNETKQADTSAAQNKFSAASSSILDRLKAEREAKKKAQENAKQAETPAAVPETKKEPEPVKIEEPPKVEDKQEPPKEEEPKEETKEDSQGLSWYFCDLL